MKKGAKKKGAKPTEINEKHKLFKSLDKKLAESLVEHILSRMGGGSISRLAEFVQSLRVTAECASETQKNLHLYREVIPKAREFRILSGRAKKATRHALAAFRKAEIIGRQLDELYDEVKQFTGPQVPDENVYQFIADFLLLLPRKMEAVPKIEATVSSVKSFLQRRKSSNQPPIL